MDNCHYTYLTSEAVTEGHPDKICDQISDAIVDAYLRQDPLSHVAVESFVSGDVLTLAGEVSSKATVDVTDIARKVIEEIGYTDSEIGFTADSCLIFTNIHQQSQDIHQGVVIRSGEDYLVGSGDQGIMYGYATKAVSYTHLTLPTILLV